MTKALKPTHAVAARRFFGRGAFKLTFGHARTGFAVTLFNDSVRHARAAFKGHSGAKKRFTEMASGARSHLSDAHCPLIISRPFGRLLGVFKFALAGRRHLATGKSRKQIRELGKTAYTNKVQTRTLQRMIGKGMRK